MKKNNRNTVLLAADSLNELTEIPCKESSGMTSLSL